MMWKPKSVSTTLLISPGFIANTASSKGLIIMPRPKKSRSPPCAAEPGSCEFFFATSAKVAGALRTSASRASALALAAVLSGSALIRMWLARRSSAAV